MIATDHDDFDGILLKIKRPKETGCPEYDASLDGWIEQGWNSIEVETRAIPARNLQDKETEIPASTTTTTQRNVTNKITNRYYGECGYFDQLTDADPFVFDSSYEYRLYLISQ